jgi:hypothetical protein
MFGVQHSRLDFQGSITSGAMLITDPMCPISRVPSITQNRREPDSVESGSHHVVITTPGRAHPC